MTSSPDYKQRDYEFGNLFKIYRNKADLTQAELADRVGLSSRTIKGWESGEYYPQPPILRHLIEIFMERGCFTESEEQREAESFWEKATNGKKDARDAFDVAWFNAEFQKQAGPLRPVKLGFTQGQPRQDWTEAVENRVLYGREQAQADLEKWINDKQRVVGVFGMGGIGKTGLVVSVAHKLASQFDFVVFRSMHNAPPLGELLDSLLRFLVAGQLNGLPTVQSEKLALVMDYLRNYRCLLVLDNLETIMQEGLAAGDFREGYTDYADFIRRVSEFAHKSCLLITSREKPRQAAFREVKNGFVRAFALPGLDNKSCQAILHSMNVASDEEQSAILTRHYGGNPLAIKLIAEPIRDIFGGNPAAFLSSDIFLYGDGEIRFILDQHFERLSPVEQDILYWLAVSREPLDVEAFQKRSLLQVGSQTFADGLSALFKRFLIEQNENSNSKHNDKKSPGFTLQGVVVEYVTQRLLNKLHAEIVAQTPELLYRYPLFQTSSREHVRQIQLRVLVEPLLRQLQTTLKRDDTVKLYLKQLLEKLRELPQSQQGYAGGNLLNMLIRFGADLSGWNLAGLALWQTNLAGAALHDVDMRGADLTGAIFTEANIGGFSVAYSPDGKQLAIGCINGSVKLWQAGATFGSQLLECLGPAGIVAKVVFSPDGSLLASGRADGTIRLWEPHSGICLAVLDAPTAAIHSIAFSPDGQWLASSGKEQTIYLWKVSNTQLVARLDAEQGWVMAVAFSQDGQLLATGGYGATIKVWDTGALTNRVIPDNEVTLRQVAELDGEGSWVHSLAFSKDGRYLASSVDRSVKLWSITRRGSQYQFKALPTLGGQNGIVVNVAFSSDSKILASGGADGVINLYNPANLAVYKSLPTGNGAVTALAFHPNGETLVSGSAENSNLKIWSLKNYEIQDILPGYINLIYSVAFSPDGKWLGVTGVDYHLLLWDLTRPETTRPVVFKGHSGVVTMLAFSPDGKTVASSARDNTIKLWNLESGKCWRTLYGPGKPVLSAVFSADNRLLISGDEEGNLKLWSLITGECLNSILAHRSRIRKILFDPTGQTLASCGEDGSISLWKVDSRNALISQQKSWHSGSHLVMSLAFNQDGSRLFSAGGEGIILVWDVISGEGVTVIDSNSGLTWALAYNAYGAGPKLAAIGGDGCIKVWQFDQADKAELLTSFEHGAKSTTIAFNNEGTRLFSGGEGGVVKVWDLANNTLAATFTARMPYAGLNIEGINNLTEAQRHNLLNLGAIESAS